MDLVSSLYSLALYCAISSNHEFHRYYFIFLLSSGVPRIRGGLDSLLQPRGFIQNKRKMTSQIME